MICFNNHCDIDLVNKLIIDVIEKIDFSQNHQTSISVLKCIGLFSLTYPNRLTN